MRRWLLCATSALALLGCGAEVAEPGDRLRAIGTPNLVLCVVDTLRADAVAPIGGPPEASPELSRWAGQGVVFENAHAQSSWTKTSMASLLTSLWPRTHGVATPNDGLGEEALTVAEVLRAGGYRTYAVQSNGWLEQTFGFQQGFDHYAFPHGGPAPWMRSALWPHADNVYREAARLLEAHPQGVPFFLYLHFMDVHEYAAPPDVERVGKGHEGAYHTALRFVDEVLERTRRALDDADLLDTTVLILASDHGEAFGEHGVHGHARSVRAVETHVPLIVRWPFEAAPVRVRARVRNLDIAPTLLDLAGLPPTAGFEGTSLLPLVSEAADRRAAAGDRENYASLRARLFPDARLQEAVADGPWRLLRDEDGVERLYDRSIDPDEHVDLAGMEAPARARLAAKLDAHLDRTARTGVAESGVRIDPDLARRLRALGYVATEAPPPGAPPTPRRTDSAPRPPGRS